MLPLLSICIPTHNRDNILFSTIKSIVEQSVFKDTQKVEIIISDNASSDKTADVCRYFQQLHPDKIKILLQATNIGPTNNHEKAIRGGSGVFRKLHNDNLPLRDGALNEMIKVIEITKNYKPTLFFLNGNVEFSDPITKVENIEQFISHVSFYCTWIGGYGLWDTQIESIHDLNRYAELQIPHTDVLLRCVSESNTTIIVNIPIFASIDVGRKGGYNIAEVFGRNYLFLLALYRDAGLLSEKTYENEKKLLLVKHIIPHYFSLKHNFKMSGFFKYLTDYRNDDYFYEAIEKTMTNMMRNQIKPNKGEESEIAILWRRFNQHNETYLVRDIDFSCIKVGRRSYGDLNVWTWSDSGEALEIGNFVSIANNVTFLLGGNHPYGGISTFPFLVKYFAERNEAKTKGPIVIEDDVWIGANSTILSGITIGKGAVVAAGSVVSKSIPPYAIVGGNPARIIKYRFSIEIQKKLTMKNFEKLSDEKIIQNRELLYSTINEENIDEILEKLFGTE